MGMARTMTTVERQLRKATNTTRPARIAPRMAENFNQSTDRRTMTD